MKTRDFERLLKDQGFTPVRQKGSHLVWSNGKQSVVVPQQSMINRMIARRLLKEIGYVGQVAELRYAG